MGGSSGSATRSSGRTGTRPAARPAAPSLATSPLPEFAATVQAVAEAAPRDNALFGNKAFIADVWDAIKDTPEGRGLTLESFKARLAEANHARLLDLSRLDLVQAVFPGGDERSRRGDATGPGTGYRSLDDIRRAEVKYLGSTFHFIRRRNPR